MDLPADIEQKILEYLHLEYGENPSDTNSLKIEDITYEGEYEIYGITTHYFHFKSSTGLTWATVEPFGDSYCIGMTTNTPKPIFKSQINNRVHIESLDSNDTAKLELEDWGDGCFGISDYTDVKLNKKIQFKLLVEVSSYSTPPAVTVGLIDGETNFYICGSVGVSLRYSSESLGEIFISVGSVG